jgi:DNA replication protein DnaC
MKQIGFIQELEQLYRMGKQLPDEWQQKHNEAMRKNYQTNYERGTITREEYQEYMLELDGGACPVCGKESMLTSKPINYRETKNGETAVIEMGRYYYYQPECSCLNQSAAQKRKASEIQKRMHEAGIPKTYHDSTFQDWDYSVDDGLNSAMRKCSQLTSQEGLQDFIGRGALLFGDVGRGKTKCGIAMMRRLMEETPMKCVYEQMAGFTGKIIKSGKERRYIDDMMMFDIIMLDDLDKLSTASTWVQEQVFSLFDMAFSEEKTLIITTNIMDMDSLEEFFGEPGAALMSRIAEKMQFVKFSGGEDYRKVKRMQEMRKENAQKS